jgi:hypothetical protein
MVPFVYGIQQDIIKTILALLARLSAINGLGWGGKSFLHDCNL